MPRKLETIDSECPYHITARCLNRDWFQIPIDEVWHLMSDYLFLISKHFQIEIHQFVLMQNHFHLVARSPELNLSSAMQYFMNQTSREMNRSSLRINQTYGARFHRSRIENYHYYMNVYKYVYQNPLRAGIIDRAEAYPYSTLNGILGFQKMIIPIVEDAILFNPEFDESSLKWINTLADPEDIDQMRRGLKRSTFKLPLIRSSRNESELESRLL